MDKKKAPKVWYIRWTVLKGLYIDDCGTYYKYVQSSDVDGLVASMLNIAKDFVNYYRKRQLWYYVCADHGVESCRTEKLSHLSVTNTMLTYAIAAQRKLRFRLLLTDGTELLVSAQKERIQNEL